MDSKVIEIPATLIGADEAIWKASQLAAKIEEAKTLAGELASMLKDVETFPEANKKKSPKELIMEIISQDGQDFHHAELNASSAVKHLHEFLKRRPE